METQIKIDHLKMDDHTGCITVIVSQSVPEYLLPETKYSRIRKIFDSYECSDYLKRLYSPATKGDHEILNKEVDNQVQRIRESIFLEEKAKYNAADFDLDDNCTEMYRIDFIKGSYLGVEYYIESTMNTWRSFILEKWLNRGADDDYYDYLPSLTDLFRQLCGLFKATKMWEEFLQQLTIQEPDAIDEAIYTVQL